MTLNIVQFNRKLLESHWKRSQMRLQSFQGLKSVTVNKSVVEVFHQSDKLNLM